MSTALLITDDLKFNLYNRPNIFDGKLDDFALVILSERHFDYIANVISNMSVPKYLAARSSFFFLSKSCVFLEIAIEVLI